MKSLFRTILVNLTAIFLIASILKGLHYDQSLIVIIKAATVLALINVILKPFLKILFLPLNVITFGLFSWAINVVILYLVTLLVSEFSISGFSLQLFKTNFVFSQTTAFIVISISLTLVLNLVNWLMRD
jgi:putative membrane protein